MRFPSGWCTCGSGTVGMFLSLEYSILSSPLSLGYRVLWGYLSHWDNICIFVIPENLALSSMFSEEILSVLSWALTFCGSWRCYGVAIENTDCYAHNSTISDPYLHNIIVLPGMWTFLIACHVLAHQFFSLWSCSFKVSTMVKMWPCSTIIIFNIKELTSKLYNFSLRDVSTVKIQCPSEMISTM